MSAATGRRRPQAGWTPFPKTRFRPGRALDISIVLHVVLIWLILRHPAQRPPDPEAARRNPIQIPVYLAPPTPPVEARYRTPQPDEKPEPLPPAVPLSEGPDQAPGNQARVTPTPEPAPNAQPEETRTPGTTDEDAARTPTPSRDAAPTPPTAPAAAPNAAATTAAVTRTLETEAQRIFGQPSNRPGPIAGVRDVRPWESTMPADSRGCTIPDEEQDTTAPPGMAVIQGRIFREDTGEPLVGARLQILGTPYGAFSNGRGEYRLVFERTLVNRCRTQQVRVSAPGYQGRDVTLMIGQRPNSDVPLRRY
jgi:hypothetical protein